MRLDFKQKQAKINRLLQKNDINVYLLYMKNPNNQKYIISVEYIGSGGDVILNILILSGKQYLEKYFKENNLEDNVYQIVSDFGYSNNKIGV